VTENPSTPFFNPEIAARLSGYALQSRQPKEGSMSGIHKSPHRGASVEFSEYRDYVPGDDLRRLDWRVFAKTDRFYMKEFEAETNLRGYLVLDASGSMNYRGSLADSKFDHSRRIASILAYLLIRQGDAVGVHLTGGEASAELPSMRKPSHLQQVFQTMTDFQCGGTNSLSATLHKLAETSRRRALVMIFSDFFTDIDELLPALQHVRHQKHEVALFEILHPREVDFDFQKSTRFKDLEGPADLVVEPSMVRQQYLHFFNLHVEKLRKAAREFDLELRRSLVGGDYEKVLVDFLAQRMRRG
jgi:uncharacterized protein (DUF58 family)